MTTPDGQTGESSAVQPDRQALVMLDFAGNAQHVYTAMLDMLSFSADFMMKSHDDASLSLTFAAYDGGSDLTAVVSDDAGATKVAIYTSDPGDQSIGKHIKRFHNSLDQQLQISAQAWNASTETMPAAGSSAGSMQTSTFAGPGSQGQGAGAPQMQLQSNAAADRKKPGVGTLIMVWFAGLNRKGRATVAWIAAGVLCALLLIGIVSCGIIRESAPLPEGMSRMPEAATTFEGQNYEDVVTQLQDAGFTNIETKAQEDLITGWVTKEGEVDKVSVAGKTNFSASDKFKSDVRIVVTYHAFPSDSSSSDDASSDTSGGDDASSEDESGSDDSSSSTDSGDASTQSDAEAESDTSTDESKDSAGITEQNNPEFASLLSGPDMGDSVSAFASKYANRVIEYDGYVASVAPHGNYKTRFDYLILAGDDDASAHGPNFQFNDVNYSDLHLSENAPDTFGMGLKVHVRAKVKSYDSSTGLFQLESVAISMR